MATTVLDITDLRVVFDHRRGPVPILDGVTLSIAPGETVALVGESGAGKSMLALAVMGLLPDRIRVARGSITLDGDELVGATPRYQQIAILIGALASALILGPILLRLNEESTIYVPQTTFRAVQNGPQLDSGAAAALPARRVAALPPSRVRAFTGPSRAVAGRPAPVARRSSA